MAATNGTNKGGKGSGTPGTINRPARPPKKNK